MSIDPTTSVTDLLLRGSAALAAGVTIGARASFRAAVERAPATTDGWLGLALATPILRERRAHVQQALQIAPDHPEALAQLSQIDDLLAQGAQIFPAQPARPSPAPAPTPAPAPAEEQPQAAEQFCYRHAERATGLLCVSCDRPICATCARPAPVGHLCPECLQRRRPVNYQVAPQHLAIGALVGAALALLGGLLVSFALRGFLGYYIVFMVAPFLGAGIVVPIDRLTHGKRGRWMQITVGAGIVVGMLPVVIFGPLLMLLVASGFNMELLTVLAADEGLSIMSIVVQGIDPSMAICMVVTAISAMYRLR